MMEMDERPDHDFEAFDGASGYACTAMVMRDGGGDACGLPAEAHIKAEAKPAEPIPVAQFEGEFVRQMEGKLPAITLEMPEGYARGTHLKMEVEVRVRNVRYEEVTRGPDKGDLVRQHVFALEEVRLLGAYSPEELDPGVGGSASAAAVAEEPEEAEEATPAYSESVGF